MILLFSKQTQSSKKRTPILFWMSNRCLQVRCECERNDMRLNFSREIKEVTQMIEKSRTQVTLDPVMVKNKRTSSVFPGLKTITWRSREEQTPHNLTLEYCPKLHRQDKQNRSSHTSQCHTIVSNRSGKANNQRENQRLHHILDHRDNRDPENYVGWE